MKVWIVYKMDCKDRYWKLDQIFSTLEKAERYVKSQKEFYLNHLGYERYFFEILPKEVDYV